VNNIAQRSITGILFLIVIISAIIFSGYLFYLIFLAITFFGLYEFYNLLKINNIRTNYIWGIIIGFALFTSIFIESFNLIDNFSPIVVLPIIFVLFITELYKNNQVPFSCIAYSVLGVVYIALPISLLSSFYGFAGGTSHLLLGYFILIWCFDTFAYLTGITLGKHRLFERISPKKSWEGFAGGTIITLFSSFILSKIFIEISLLNWLVISIIVIVCGTYGDLVESMFKRSLNTKDSGVILPGHGGILDRFDAVFISSPFVYTYMVLITNYEL